MSKLVKVGITHGDYNGVGYEVILKALGDESITELFTPVVFGVKSIAGQCIDLLGLDNLKLHTVKKASEAKEGKINLVEICEDNISPHPGEIAEHAGTLAAKALERAVDDLKKGNIDVLVTAPISKEAIQGRNFNFPGHTEFLEDKIGDGRKAMMILCDEKLRVALMTIHIPVAQIPEKVTVENVVNSVETFASVLKKDFGCERPSIAVLSLNPHSGDGGIIGKEEEEIIKPALSELREKGIMAFGPYAADGFFGHGSYKNFDGVLAMYHDQGLAPFKTLATGGGVNFTANLPFVRTSPDHGTAYDIAWKGVADETSMKEAIYMAIDIFRRRRNFETASANPLQKYVTERPDRGERQEKPIKKTTQPAEMSND